MTDILELSTATFESEVLQSGLPVVVDFTAVWCAPCKMLAPVVEQLAQQWDGKVKVARLDVDYNADVAMQYSVMGVPTLILFVGGKPVQRLTGYQSKDRILAKFSAHL